jgi:hypothetical protein
MGSGWQLAAAAMLVAVPILVGAILLFGGGQVNACLGGGTCGLPPPRPVIGLFGVDVAGAAALALAIGWLGLALVVARHVAQRDGRRLGRAAVAVVILAAGSGMAAGLVKIAEGASRRPIVEGAALWAIGALIVVTPLALGWAVLTVGRRSA